MSQRSTTPDSSDTDTCPETPAACPMPINVETTRNDEASSDDDSSCPSSPVMSSLSQSESSSASSSSRCDMESSSESSSIPSEAISLNGVNIVHTQACLRNHRLHTYKLVGDNIDKKVKPREMRSNYQARDLHYFHTYAVRDRVDMSELSGEEALPDLASMQLHNLLPSSCDEKAIYSNFAILVVRTLKKYMPFFEKFAEGLEHHIMHEYYMGNVIKVRSG